MESLHLVYQLVLLLSTCYQVAMSLNCSVEIQSYSKSDSTKTGRLSLGSEANELVWSDRTTAGVVLFAVATDCTVSHSSDLTYTDETDFMDDILSFVQDEPLGTYIVGATLYEVLYDSIATQNLFRALGVHMFGTFDGTLFELYSSNKNDRLYADTYSNDGTLLFVTQKGSKHKALYKSFEGGQGGVPTLTTSITLDNSCVPPLPGSWLFQGGQTTTTDTNRRFSQQSANALTGCAGETIKGWQYIPSIDISAGLPVNLYILNTATGAALLDTAITTSGQSTSTKVSMCLPDADHTVVSADIKYGLYYDNTADGASLVQALYPTFEGALTGHCGYDPAVTDLDKLKALDTTSIFSNGGTDIVRSHAFKPILDPAFLASCECTNDAYCQDQSGDSHLICESSQCACEEHYSYDPESNTCQFTLNPLSISLVVTSGVSEGSVEEIYDTDVNGDPDLTTSLALSPTANPWIVIDMGTETTVNSVDISVPEVQYGVAELICCGTDTFLYTFDHNDVENNVTCDTSTPGNECTEVNIAGPYAWLFFDQVNYEGNSVLIENSPGVYSESHTLTSNPASIRRVDELGVLQSTTTSACVDVDGSDNAILQDCDMEVYFESDLVRRKSDGMVLNPTSTSDGAALSFSSSTTMWKTEDKDSDANTGVDADDLAAGAYLELQSDSSFCLGLQSGSTNTLALRSKASNTDDCLVFKQKTTIPRLLAQQQEQFDITLDGDGDCTNDVKDYQNTYSYPACSAIKENSGTTAAHIIYNSGSELAFAASDQGMWADCAGSSTQRIIFKADNPSLHDFVVSVSNSFSGTYSSAEFSTCATYSGTLRNGDQTTVQCDTPLTGRYLAITIPSMDTNEVIFLSGITVNGNKKLPVGDACSTDTECQSQGGGLNFVCISSSCQCADGYTYEPLSEACVDANECTLNTNGCGQDCTNSRGSYSCSCNQYCTLEADQHTCDCPSCSVNNGGCVNGACLESGTAGLVACSCDTEGTTLDTDQKTCVNINECEDAGLHDCDQETTGLAQCVDLNPITDGGLEWQCDCGDEAIIEYNPVTETCEILDSIKTDGATANSLCSMNNGGCSDTCTAGANPLDFTCSCPDGAHLLPDGLTCVVCDPVVKADCDADVNNLGFCTNDPTDINQDICACEYSELGIFWNGDKCTTGLNPDHVCTGTDHGCTTTCNPGVNIQDFTCSCDSGFELGIDGKTCGNIDECADPDTCATTGTPVPTCNDNVGSFTCDCGIGYTWDGSLCKNINECAVNNGGCEQTCLDSEGSFQCSCDTGYNLDPNGFGCNDINECDTGNGGCGANTECENTPGSSRCNCLIGYQFIVSSVTVCEDIDECSSNNGGCNHNCNNSQGSFECICDPGFELSGDQLTCININECALGIDACEHECRDTEGSFVCECQIGYEIDPNDEKACIDILECETGLSNCGQLCTNIVGSFQCTCNAGYNLNSDKATCTAESECTGVNCVLGQCSAIDSGYVCICDAGYELSADAAADTCEDIDECALDVCRANSQCQNSVGGFSCPCDSGYSAAGTASACEDIDECLGDPCPVREVCTNTAGAYTCQCDSQFVVSPEGECTSETKAIYVFIVLVAPATPTLPSAESFEESGATLGTVVNFLLVQMCQIMYANAGYDVTCIVTSVSISSLAVNFEVEFAEEETQSASQIAVLPQQIYDSLSEDNGEKVVTLGNETLPLNTTGTVIAVSEFVTPDGRHFSANDTEPLFGVDRNGDTGTTDANACTFFNIISFCLNGSNCFVNDQDLPECSCVEGFQGEQCNELIPVETTTTSKLTGTEVILISIFVPLFVIGAGILLFWICYSALRSPAGGQTPKMTQAAPPPAPRRYSAYPHRIPPTPPTPKRRPRQRWWDEYSSSPEAVGSETRQERLSRWPAYQAYGIASRFPGASSYYGNGWYGNRY